MGKKHKLSGFISDLAGDLFEAPSASLPGGWSVSLTDGREANVSGCRAILSYDSEKITVDIGGERLSIVGERLDISRYTDGEITVRGDIVLLTTVDDETEAGTC